MREIKFRQPINSGGFHYWGYVTEDKGSFVAPCGRNAAAGPSQEYTGLKDKNGKEIYEGDIVKGGGWTRSCYVIIYNQFSCQYIGKLKGDLIYYINEGEQSFMEVIGNIHENPELIDE